MEARRYIDRQAVRYGRCMVDTGTLGLQASTQVIIAMTTLCYYVSNIYMHMYIR